MMEHLTTSHGLTPPLTFNPRTKVTRCPNARLFCRVCNFATDVTARWSEHFTSDGGHHRCKELAQTRKGSRDEVSIAEQYRGVIAAQKQKAKVVKK